MEGGLAMIVVKKDHVVQPVTEGTVDLFIREGWELVEDDSDKPIDKYTVPELEAFAEAQGIDLTGAGNKAEKLAAIKAAIDVANEGGAPAE